MDKAVAQMALICVLLVVGAMISLAERARAEDLPGILRKPVPDKLVVLSFDDGCASHATTVAPILKSLGFGGTFYVCDGFSFGTRKDWYLTWRQIKAMAGDGFEIGNHTVGHCGGAGIDNFRSMEDRFLAHGCPKTTTVCWPGYQVNTRAYRDLAADGYTFGRGGYERPYRPTIDNPFDVPSFTIRDSLSPEAFVRQARQAADGKIVVFCYHGVPDMEHPSVGLEPAVFKAQMQYLKDNNYKAISMRDLAEYIDPAKAAKLPPTARGGKESGPVTLARELKPYVVLPVDNPQGDGQPATKPPSKPARKTAPVTYGPKDHVLKFDKRGDHTADEPRKLATDLAVDVVENGNVKMPSLISGTGRLIKNGKGRLIITNAANTYSGGTVINDGTLMMFVKAHEALGFGPITLNGGTLALELIHGTNPLILNGGTIHAGNGFGDSWNAPIALNGDTKFSVYSAFDLNDKSGGMSGPGGFTVVGGGRAVLGGVNTYAGQTTVCQGTLVVRKPASLYNADPVSWTPTKITVFNTATLLLGVGGKEEFTCAQAGTLLTNLTTGVNHNGLTTGGVFCLDTSGATNVQDFSVNIADADGPGGGPFTFKKTGTGALRLSGENTYTGRMILEDGMLIVASLNRVVGGAASSSLGSPTTLENGMIDLGGNCTLRYTGKGEVTDRIIDLTGKNQTVTLDQSGSGLLKFASPFDISGFGYSKTIVLKGATAGTGEFAGNIKNPYDRKNAARMSLAKRGTGTWTLSGINTYTGPTTIEEGTLAIADSRSLGESADIHIADGAALVLNFKGRANVRKLTLGGKPQPAGTYHTTNSPAFIKGDGVLVVQP